MDSWQDLIKEWGGATRFARDIGINEQAGHKMYQRNSVHSDYWPVIVARAQRAGVDGVTVDLLISLKTGRPVKPGGRFPRSVMA